MYYGDSFVNIVIFITVIFKNELHFVVLIVFKDILKQSRGYGVQFGQEASCHVKGIAHDKSSK